jgi:flagellar motility protein MotE (MotC chaperone)
MRVHLLPLLMFALAGTVTIKVGAVWNALDVSIGRESLAQAQPAAEPAAEGSPAPTAQPTTTPATAGEQAATGQPAPAEGVAPSEPSPQQAATTPASPESSGAGEATSAEAAAAAKDDEPVPDPFDYTDEEVDVLQQLAKRREELDLRARQLDEREALVQAAEQRMEQKMAELKALQATLEELLKTRSEQEEAELKSLVKMYENMKPKAAAKVFEEMDMDVLLENERKVAPILALVTPTRAKEITFELAQRRELPVPE